MAGEKMIVYLQWIAVSLSLGGGYLINKKNVYGFYCWVISNLIWIACFAITQQWPSTFLFTIYELMSIHGIILWRRETSI